MKRVVVTGLGAVSPCGIGAQEMWENLIAGNSGIGYIENIDTKGFSTIIGGEVKNWNSDPWIPPKEASRMDRFTQFAVAASVLAIENSGLDVDKLDLDRCGAVVGSGIGGIESMEEQYRRFAAKGPSRVTPFMIPLLMINAAAGQIAIRFGFKGVNYGPVSACASAAHSLGLALKHIQLGEADVMVAGGSEAGISALGLGGFCNMKALSRRNDDPLHASRPFDKERDGFVIAEGSGLAVLEELEHAKKRGAKIYAEFVGSGMNDDAYHITAPAEDGTGGCKAMQSAMKSGGINPEDVDYINAHGTSTPYNDKTETKAIRMAFGDNADKLAVSSTKSMTGHLLGASGGVEFIAACYSIMENRLAPTVNYTTPRSRVRPGLRSQPGQGYEGGRGTKQFPRLRRTQLHRCPAEIHRLVRAGP